jgi:hypothetical protein
LARKRREIDALEAEWLEMVAEYDRSGAWRTDGYESAAAAVQAVCRCTRGVARGHVVLAQKLAALPHVAAAFGKGEISRAHASVIADAYTADRAAAISEMEPQLVEIARVSHPRQLRTIVQRFAEAIDGDGGSAADEARHARRTLYLAVTLGGTGILEATSEPIGHEIIATALAKEMDRDFQRTDPRTRPQRRYDALVNICRRDLERGGRGTRRTRPHISVVVDLAEIEGRSLAVAASVRNEAEHGGRLSRATLEQLMCDCSISRVITSGQSEVVDVGRATRTISAQLWKALVVRDGHCTAPGCERPPGECDGHHVRHWTKGGPTDLANLQLLCWDHHRAVHRGARGP